MRMLSLTKGFQLRNYGGYLHVIMKVMIIINNNNVSDRPILLLLFFLLFFFVLNKMLGLEISKTLRFHQVISNS